MAKEIPYLDVQNLSKSFGALTLFRNISFSIAEGQKVGLIAKNGTGKSTLLSVISCKEGHDTGDIIFRRDLKVGYLEQAPAFDPEESVLDACFNHHGEDEKVLKAKQVLTQLKIQNLDQPMGQLSGGQQKRVALANVLLTEPDLLILDEPTNHLDLEMIEWLEGYLTRGNRTLLMVTHDRFFLDRVCSVIMELDDNTIYTYRGNYSYYLEKRQERIDARRAEIARANNLYRTELEWMRRMPQARGHKARYREEAFYELEKVARQRMEERQLRLKSSNVYIGSKIFECQYISKAWSPECVIMKDFYYNFSRFEKMGIVGNNGSGKTVLMKCICGFLIPTEGEVIVNGKRVGKDVDFPPGLGLIIETPGFLPNMTGVKNLEILASLNKKIGLEEIAAAIRRVGLDPLMKKPVGKYSLGMRQRLGIAQAIMEDPALLILDEPLNGLDKHGVREMRQLIKGLKEQGKTILLASHNQGDIDELCDTVCEMDAGVMTMIREESI